VVDIASKAANINHAFTPKNIVILSATKWSEKSFCLKGGGLEIVASLGIFYF
jgi:hypothetical protein